jgi:hypothetical protein
VFKKSHATRLGKRLKKLEKGFFLCVVCFMKGEMLKLGNLRRISKGTSKKKLQRLVVNSTSFLLLLMVMLS